MKKVTNVQLEKTEIMETGNGCCTDNVKAEAM